MACNLASAIAECLHLHAQAKDRLDTEYPERLPRVPEAVRAKVIRQRERVSNTLSGVTPEQHVAEIESLNAGLRLILKKLAPVEPEPARPPMPVWDNTAKRWCVPVSGRDRIAELAEQFDQRGPDTIDDL